MYKSIDANIHNYVRQQIQYTTRKLIQNYRDQILLKLNGKTALIRCAHAYTEREIDIILYHVLVETQRHTQYIFSQNDYV